MKISKVSRQVKENTRDIVEIKKDNINKDFDSSTEDCN